MNKYIQTDIEQAITLLKIAINNALMDLETGEEKEIHFGCNIPLSLIIHCAEDRDWKDDPNDNWNNWTNGWDINYSYKMINQNIKDKYLGISGSLLYGNTYIYLDSCV